MFLLKPFVPLLMLFMISATAGAQTIRDITSTGTSATHNGVIFKQGDGISSSETGIFDPFYRIAASFSSNVSGVNTGNSVVQFETDNGTWTTELLLSTVTQIEIGGILYREFFLDINQTLGQTIYDIIDIQIYTDDQPDLNDLDPSTRTWGASDTGPQADPPIFWLDGAPDGDGSVRLNYALEAGSGQRDMRMLVPDADFGAPPECDYGQDGCGIYVYVYSAFNPNDDGFEEWSTAIQPFVQISKTAVGSLEESTNWTIEKSVVPDSWDLFTGDAGTSEYTIQVDKTVVQGATQVTGQVTLVVPETLPDGDENAPDANVTSLTDIYEGLPATSISCVDDAGASQSVPFTINPGETFICDYTVDLASEVLGTNIATALVVDRDGGDRPFVATADVGSFSVTSIAEPGTINVSDTNGRTFGPFSDDDVVTYEKTFSCNADEGVNDNVASIDETGDSDDASVTVNCYTPTVSKTADTSFKREWNWDIDKTAYVVFDGDSNPKVPYADLTPIEINAGDNTVIEWEVTVETEAVPFVDSDWSVSGDITISNNHPDSTAKVLVGDLIRPGAITPVVSCTADMDGVYYLVPAGGSIACSYGPQSLADGSQRTNVATATQKNYNYDSAKNATNAGTTEYSSKAADVIFSLNNSTVKVDQCVDVTDDNEFAPTPFEPLPPGTNPVCAPDDGGSSAVFQYQQEIVATTADCEGIAIPNTAAYRTVAGDEFDSADFLVEIDVVCEDGCTFSHGYWKTHNASFKGGASKKADRTWCQLEDYDGNGNPDCENESFFLSGQTWFDVFWTSPKGNPYYNLARQWIAAHLNNLNDASLPAAVQVAYDDALDLFLVNAPGDLNGGLKKKFRALVDILDQYNQGLAGVPHCDDYDDPPLDLIASLSLSAEADMSPVEAADLVEAAGVEPSQADLESDGVEGDSNQDAETADRSLDVEVAEELPTKFAIGNYPNPFNPQTTVQIDVPESAVVSVGVYDLMGRLVTSLKDGTLKAGRHNVMWDASAFPSGSYFIVMRSNDFVQTIRATMLK